MKFSQRLRWFVKSEAPDARRARRIARIVFVLFLFVVLFWIVPIEDVFRSLVSAQPLYVLLGLFLAFMAAFLTAVQMWPLLRQQQIGHSMIHILEVNLVAKFYSLFAPGALVAGGVKWYRFAQPDGKVAEAFAALAFFRLLETFINLALGLGFWFLSEQETVEIRPGWLVAMVIAIILVWVLVTRLSLPVYRWLKSRGGKMWKKPFLERILGWLEKLLTAVSAYADMPAWDLLFSVAAGVISQLVGVWGNLYLAYALGIAISYIDLGWVYSILNIATQLPFAIGGGIGIRDVTLVAILPTLAVSLELALAYSFLLFGKSLFLSSLGGLWEAAHALRGERPAIAADPKDPNPGR
jgi:uncharacterized membrane protein YbhN (UPF0104 family)